MDVRGSVKRMTVAGVTFYAVGDAVTLQENPVEKQTYGDLQDHAKEAGCRVRGRVLASVASAILIARVFVVLS